MNANISQSTGTHYAVSGKRQPGYKWVGDRELSTYRWVIFMQNRGEDVKIEGYSKDVKSREKEDKQQLLQDCLYRLFQKGYLDGCYYWAVFKREFMAKDRDTLILELSPETYLAHDYLTLDLSTIGFLDRVYIARKTQGAVRDYTSLMPVRQTAREVEKADFLFTLERFPDQQALAKYCSQLQHKYGRNRVLGWYYEKVKLYTTSQRQPEPGATVSGLDESNNEMIQRAQRAMLSMQNKFNVR